MSLHEQYYGDRTIPDEQEEKDVIAYMKLTKRQKLQIKIDKASPAPF